MPAPKRPAHFVAEAAEAYKRAGNNGYQLLNLPRSTFEHRVKSAIKLGMVTREQRRSLPADFPMPVTTAADTVHVTAAPPEDEPIEDLIARKKSHMQRALAHDAWATMIPVRVKESGPIGLFLVGDPHVDDDYCDIEALEHDLRTVAKTKAFLAGHIGDITNNWVGRLKALYANQSTRFRDGLRLAEWMFDLCPSLFVVGGNHDRWEKGMDLLRFVVKQDLNGPLQAHGVRMNLAWPSGEALRMHARHDFPGKSQYSDTHGMKREVLFGFRDHLLACGHIHTDEQRMEPSVDEDDAHLFVRVSGYKRIDDFAKENGHRRRRLGRGGVSVILDPKHRTPAERMKPYWDVEEAADILTFKRKKACT